MKKARTYIGDVVINILIFAFCIAFFMILRYNYAKVSTVTVTLDGKTAKTLDLSQNSSYSPDGGHTMVTVKDGKAYISDSDCPDGLCLLMNPVTKDGGSVICLPNRVAVVSEKSNNGGGADYAAG